MISSVSVGIGPLRPGTPVKTKTAFGPRCFRTSKATLDAPVNEPRPIHGQHDEKTVTQETADPGGNLLEAQARQPQYEHDGGVNVVVSLGIWRVNS